MVKKAYECYFGCKVGDQNKKWAPHVCFIFCVTILREWLNNKGRSMPFALPIIWREPTDHLTVCYFCIISPLRYGITKKTKRTVNYPYISSAIRLVPHTEDLPVPVPLPHCILDSDDEPTENREKTPQPPASTVADFTAYLQFNEFHRITQEELNDLIGDLDLPKSKAEVLGARLQKWSLLKENVRISVYRKRHEDLVQFLKMERGLVACIDIDGLMQTLSVNHNPLDWRLFRDSCKLSLKAVLLHNGNTIPSLPVGHSVHNVSYENMKILMEAINYDKLYANLW